MSPIISIIIVNYNVKDFLSNCILSIRQSEVDAEVEVIVVDNHSYDGSVEMINTQFPEVQVIPQEKNFGFAKGVNIGIAAASGNYILILNPDTILEESTLSILLKYLEDHPNVGICGPKIMNADGSIQASCKRSFPTPGVALPKILGLDRLFPHTRWAGRYNLTYLDPDQIHKVDALSGSFMLIRKQVIETIGNFDEKFFMFGEDLDYCFRTNEAGFEIHYVPLTQIIHYKGESVKIAPFDSIRYFYDAMSLFVEKHFSPTTSFVTRLGLKFGIIARKFVAFISSAVRQLIPALLDIFVVFIGFAIAVSIRFGTFVHLFESYIPVLIIYSIFWILVGSIFQLYSRFVLSYNRAMLSSFLGFLIIVAFTYFFKQFAYSRAVILIAATVIMFGIPGWRLVAHILISRGIIRKVKVGHSPIFSRRAVIVGAGFEGKRIAQRIGKRLDTGIEVVGFIDDSYKLFVNQNGQNVDHKISSQFLGTTEDIRGIVNAHSIREIIFTSDILSNEDILRIMNNTRDLRLTYRIVPQDRDILLGKASVEDLSDIPFVNIEYSLYNRIHQISKRTFDILMSSFLLLLFSPIFIILLLNFSMWEKVKFWGVNGSKFQGWIAPSKNRFLREIPLLIKIFIGQMSFVGSSLIPMSGDNLNLLCKPGLTGLDRIKNASFDSDERVALEQYYIQHQSMMFDVEIMIRTMFAF